MSRVYPGRITKPLPRVELAPISTAAPEAPIYDRDAETKACCPWCAPHGGAGAVPIAVRQDWLERYPELRPVDDASVIPAPCEPDPFPDEPSVLLEIPKP